jgi:hypothetical protein
MKFFQLLEEEKVLAEGVELSNGKVCVHWLGDTQSIVIWDSMDDFYKISVETHPNKKRRIGVGYVKNN